MPDKRLTAQEILDSDKEKFEGQKMSPKKLEQAQEKMAKRTEQDYLLEAVTFTEETIKWLNEEWNSREFTAEQRVFSLALTFVKLRETFPADKGGIDKFEEVANSAAAYYVKNIST
jgi:hypothetical protein